MDPNLFTVIVGLVTGAGLSAAAVYKFFSALKSDPAEGQVGRQQLGLYGAALNDTLTLGKVADELRELRILGQRNAEIDALRAGELVKAIDRLGERIVRAKRTQ